MTAKLVAEEGVLKELVLSFDNGDQWVIGRDPDACQLLVEDLAASRKHALAKKTPEGITIQNLSLTNPTLVNETEVPQPQVLHQGDTVKIGDTIFGFYEDGTNIIDETSQNDTQSNSINQPEDLSKDTKEKQDAQSQEGDKETVPVPTEDTSDEKITLDVDEDKPSASIFEEDGSQSKEQIAHVNFDLTETGRWLLKVVGGPNSGAEFAMQAGHSYLIGSDAHACDIVFYDNTVSRQHVRITVNKDDSLILEDLKSRNGTRVDGELVSPGQSHPLQPNMFISIGTTSFVIYDREGEMQTIISPLMPSIVNKLKNDENEKKDAETQAQSKPAEELAATPAAAIPAEPKKPTHTLGAFILVWILIGLFALVGLGIQTLFVQEPVVVTSQVDTNQVLTEALAQFPNVKFSFNKTTGRLLLVGHVLTVTDKNQLEYNLQGLKFIKDIDDSGVIIDEYVWLEANQVLNKNPAWKGVTVHSPSPGRFVLSGYLQTRTQADQVWDYLTRNFPYLDLLENKITVEEDVLAAVNSALHNKGFNSVKVEMSLGELTLSGNIPVGSLQAFDALVAQFKEIPGIRNVNNLVHESERSEAVINISDRYVVTGSSQIEGSKLNVVINGRILTEGDVLDGMKITKVTSSYIILEKNGVIYRIDFNQ